MLLLADKSRQTRVVHSLVFFVCGLRLPFSIMLHLLVISAKRARTGVIGAEQSLKDRKDAPVERVSLPVATLHPVKFGEVVQRLSDIGIVLAEGLLADFQVAHIEGLSLFIAALRVVEQGDVVQRDSNVGMGRAEGFFFDSEGAPVAGSASS